AEDGIRAFHVTGVQTCALPILARGTRHRDQAPHPVGGPGGGTAAVPAEAVRAGRPGRPGRLPGPGDELLRTVTAPGAGRVPDARSEERRVGKGWGVWWATGPKE